MNRRERRRQAKLNAIPMPPMGPPVFLDEADMKAVPCRCSKGHMWFTMGSFAIGMDTQFDDEQGRFCPECGRPEEYSPEYKRIDPKTITIVYRKQIEADEVCYADERLFPGGSESFEDIIGS